MFFDNIIVQLAKFAKVNINTTQDLIPALFLKSFSDSTVSWLEMNFLNNNKISIELCSQKKLYTQSFIGTKIN